MENAADAIPEAITPDDLKGRNFRNHLSFTIDPADAKDFDDALSFKKLESGNFEVGTILQMCLLCKERFSGR